MCSLTWLQEDLSSLQAIGQGLSSLPYGPLHRLPELSHHLAAGFPQGEYKKEQPRQKHRIFLKLISEVI